MDADTEVLALWAAVFGEPPPILASAPELIRYLVAGLPRAPLYEPEAVQPPEPLDVAA